MSVCIQDRSLIHHLHGHLPLQLTKLCKARHGRHQLPPPSPAHGVGGWVFNLDLSEHVIEQDSPWELVVNNVKNGCDGCNGQWSLLVGASSTRRTNQLQPNTLPVAKRTPQRNVDVLPTHVFVLPTMDAQVTPGLRNPWNITPIRCGIVGFKLRFGKTSTCVLSGLHPPLVPSPSLLPSRAFAANIWIFAVSAMELGQVTKSSWRKHTKITASIIDREILNHH